MNALDGIEKLQLKAFVKPLSIWVKLHKSEFVSLVLLFWHTSSWTKLKLNSIKVRLQSDVQKLFSNISGKAGINGNPSCGFSRLVTVGKQLHLIVLFRNWTRRYSMYNKTPPKSMSSITLSVK